MSTRISRWAVPALALVIGVLIVAAGIDRHASPVQYVVGFAVVVGYAIGLRLLQSRSDMASLLSGLPRDERWESINQRALSLGAEVIAIVLVGAFLVAQFAGFDATPYEALGVIFAATYLGGLAWYQARG